MMEPTQPIVAFPLETNANLKFPPPVYNGRSLLRRNSLFAISAVCSSPFGEPIVDSNPAKGLPPESFPPDGRTCRGGHSVLIKAKTKLKSG
jgi:hypothetical protein